MTEIKKQIADALCAAAGGALDAETLCAAFEYPPSADMGDLAFPCFRLSKTLRKAPPAIAAELAQGFTCPAVSRVEVASGYLNFFFDKDYLVRHVIDRTLHADVPYGSSEDGTGKTVVLDYSSPNVAKPFHIGHLGTTVIGHSLKKLHAFAGWHCIGINHLGDWGTQFGKLIVAYRKWGSREAVEKGEIDELVALYVKFHAEAEKDPSLEDEARAEFTKLEHGDAENLALWKWFIEISLREYKKTYALLGIEFDSYNGESFYTDKMPRQVEILREKNLLTLDDGASIVDLGKYNMPPCLILKRDGSTLYPTRDIAAAVYRMDTYHFDKCIYVTSAGQSLRCRSTAQSWRPARATSCCSRICSPPRSKRRGRSSRRRTRPSRTRTRSQSRSASARSCSTTSPTAASRTSTLSWRMRSRLTATPALTRSTPTRARAASCAAPGQRPRAARSR